MHSRSSTNRQSDFGSALWFHYNNRCVFILEQRDVYMQHSKLNGINIINFIVIYEFNDITKLFTFFSHLAYPLKIIVTFHCWNGSRILIAHFSGIFCLSQPLSLNTWKAREQWHWINFILCIFRYVLSSQTTPKHNTEIRQMNLPTHFQRVLSFLRFPFQHGKNTHTHTHSTISEKACTGWHKKINYDDEVFSQKQEKKWRDKIKKKWKRSSASPTALRKRREKTFFKGV